MIDRWSALSGHDPHGTIALRCSQQQTIQCTARLSPLAGAARCDDLSEQAQRHLQGCLGREAWPRTDDAQAHVIHRQVGRSTEVVSDRKVRPLSQEIWRARGTSRAVSPDDQRGRLGTCVSPAARRTVLVFFEAVGA